MSSKPLAKSTGGRTTAKATTSTTRKGASAAKTGNAATSRSRRTTKTAVQEDVESKATQHPVVNLAQVPGKEFFDSYVSRKVQGNHSEMDVFEYCRKNRHNLLIEGPTGPGKTSAVLAYAAREKRPFYAIPSNIGIEPSQLFGKFIPDGKGGYKWVDGPVTTIVRTGGVLLINEVNFIPERVATVLFGLLDKRRQIILLDHEAEVIPAADDLLIVADMNPDYEGTRPLNKAFRNRFGVQLWWDYDPVVEAQLVKSEALRNMAGNIRDEAAKGTYETPVATNMLMEFERITEDMGIDFAIMNFVNHFTQDERPPIKVVCDTWKANIENDLLSPADTDGGADDGEAEEMSEEDILAERRMAMKDGDVDPEWGVKGVDWVWEEE